MNNLTERALRVWKDPAVRSAISRHIAIGVSSVAAATIIKAAVQAWGPAPPSYVLFPAAIAFATWFAGWPAGVIAVAIAGLIVQPIVFKAPASGLVPNDAATFLLFVAEGLVVAIFVDVLRRRDIQARLQRQEADMEIARLRRREQDLRLIEHAFDAVAARLKETACLILDVQGRVARWNAAAERVYGYVAESVLGAAWPTLGAQETPTDVELRKLIHEATINGEAVGVEWVRRADGSRFRAEATVSPLHSDAGALRGFTVIIHDLTTEQASQEFRSQAIAAQEALQGEADALTEQLETIQSVLAPELSELPPVPLLRELMGRVLAALHIDGVALIDTREPADPQLITAPRGVQAQAKRGPARLPPRLRIMQNDDDRIRELGVVSWPESMALMATVPITREKFVFGALEVVTRRPRRWTERDALILLLAADRAAAVLTASGVVQASMTPRPAEDRLSAH